MHTLIKVSMKKNISYQLKIMKVFGEKKVNELIGLNLTQKIKDVKYSKTDVKIKWYYDGTLNASANCIDRHLKDKKNKTAIIWVGDDPKILNKLVTKNFIKMCVKLQTA